MNPAAAIAMAVFGAAAVGDWIAVARSRKRLQYLLKPLALVALVSAAVALDPTDDARRALFVVALVLSLAGDVFLMLPRDLFVAGLGSFLLAHLAYIAGFAQDGGGLWTIALSLVVIAAGIGLLGLRIVEGARGTDPRLVLPVSVYMVVIAVMAAMAVADGSLLAAVGALLFLVSDSLIGWTRFVQPVPWAPVGIMVTYHAAQFLLVLSLLA